MMESIRTVVRHTASLWVVLLAALATAQLTACGGDEPAVSIDLRIVPARLDAAPAEPAPDGWQRVAFAGGEPGRAGSYLVATEPLLTGWNITAFHTAEQPDGKRAITLRVNAAGQRKLEAFIADAANLKAPLGVQVDGRWASFSPLLRPPGDRMTLYGLTPEEVSRLQRWLEVR